MCVICEKNDYPENSRQVCRDCIGIYWELKTISSRERRLKRAYQHLEYDRTNLEWKIFVKRNNHETENS
jgi:hypothetical protein